MIKNLLIAVTMCALAGGWWLEARKVAETAALLEAERELHATIREIDQEKLESCKIYNKNYTVFRPHGWTEAR